MRSCDGKSTARPEEHPLRPMLVWGITPFAAVAVSVPNYRSLGGIKCGDRVVRHNTILRSATPSNATAADVAYLRGTLQLASVVDLRAPEEALKDPGARRLPEKVDHVYHSSKPRQSTPAAALRGRV